MTREEIVQILRAHIGKTLRVSFLDGVVQTALIGSVDAEGFVHSGPGGELPDAFWTRLEDVATLEAESSN